MPFYRLLHKHDDFQWNKHAKEAFQEFKQYLKQLLIHVPQKEDEVMLLYVAATPKVVSVVLVIEHQVEKSTK